MGCPEMCTRGVQRAMGLAVALLALGTWSVGLLVQVDALAASCSSPSTSRTCSWWCRLGELLGCTITVSVEIAGWQERPRLLTNLREYLLHALAEEYHIVFNKAATRFEDGRRDQRKQRKMR